MDARPTSLEEFLDEMCKRFLAPMYEKEARIKLWSITQKKEESVHTFAARFQNLLARLSSYDNVDMLERFVRALLPPLRMPVAQKEPSTLEEAIRYASHLELLTMAYDKKANGNQRQQPQQQQQQGQRGGFRGGFRGNYRGGRGRWGRGGRAQFGAVQGGGQGPPQQPGQGSYGRGQIECFRCGGIGHMAWACPTPDMRGGGRGRGFQQGHRGGQTAAGNRGRGQARGAAVLHAVPATGAQQHPQARQAAPAHPGQGNA